MAYVIGVDCGGTKTEAEAYSVEGQLLASCQTGFGNLVVDYKTGFTHITEAIETIFSQLDKEECLTIILGIAGIDSGGLREKVAQDLASYHSSIQLINDGQLAHYSILKGLDGVTVTAGTGSVILGLNGDDWYRVGGWGHLFGDEGGAYFIAKEGIKQGLKEYDEALPVSSLTKALFTFFEVTTVFELTKKVYSLDKGAIASAATVVASLTQTDEVARRIIQQAGQDLGKSISQIIRKMPLTKKPVVIGLNGSVVEKNEEVLQAMMAYLDQEQISYQLTKKQESCAKGAYYLNQRNGDQ